MLITPEYKKLNEDLHETNKFYGTSGAKWAQPVLALAKNFDTQDILDYGCGKSTLAQNLPFEIKQYDPCVPQHSTPPEPAAIVVCTDVLEHIEPDLIDDVLDDIKRLTLKVAFLSIANKEAKKFLSDGRNAHLIQKDDKWWLQKLSDRFVILEFSLRGSFGNKEQNTKDMLEYLVCATPRV